MKKKILFYFLVVFCIFAISAKSKTLDSSLKEASKSFAEKLDSTSKAIAIVDLTSGYNTLDEYLMETMKHNMSIHLRKAVLVERNKHVLSLIKNENIYQESGAVRDDTIQDIGSALGADCLIFGSVKTVSGGYQIFLQAVDIVSKKVLVSYKNKLAKSDKEIAFQIKNKKQQNQKIDPSPLLQKKIGNNVEIKTIATMYNTNLSYKDIVNLYSGRLTEILSNYRSTIEDSSNPYYTDVFYPLNIIKDSFVFKIEDMQKGDIAWSIYETSTKNSMNIYLATNAFVLCLSFETTNKKTPAYSRKQFYSDYATILAESANTLFSVKKEYSKEQFQALANIKEIVSTTTFKWEREEPATPATIISDAWKTYYDVNCYLTNYDENFNLIDWDKGRRYVFFDLTFPKADPKKLTEMGLNIKLNENDLASIFYNALWSVCAYKKNKFLVESVVDYFISKGFNPNPKKYKPIFAFAQEPWYLFDMEPLSKLIKAGAKVKVVSDEFNGQTPIATVVFCYCFSLISNRGRDWYSQDTIIDEYFDVTDTVKEFISYLIKAGVNVNAKDKYGKTALDYIKDDIELIKSKMEHPYRGDNYLFGSDGIENLEDLADFLKEAGAK